MFMSLMAVVVATSGVGGDVAGGWADRRVIGADKLYSEIWTQSYQTEATSKSTPRHRRLSACLPTENESAQKYFVLDYSPVAPYQYVIFNTAELFTDSSGCDNIACSLRGNSCNGRKSFSELTLTTDGP